MRPPKYHHLIVPMLSTLIVKMELDIGWIMVCFVSNRNAVVEYRC